MKLKKQYEKKNEDKWMQREVEIKRKTDALKKNPLSHLKTELIEKLSVPVLNNYDFYLFADLFLKVLDLEQKLTKGNN